MPIDAGLCSYGDIYTLSIDDFANMNEILMVRSENEKRARAVEERKRKK